MSFLPEAAPHTTFFFFFFGVLIKFSDCSPGWPHIHYIAQAGLVLLAIILPWSPKCKNYRCGPLSSAPLLAETQTLYYQAEQSGEFPGEAGMELGPKPGFSLLALTTCGGQSHKDLLLWGQMSRESEPCPEGAVRQPALHPKDLWRGWD